MGFGGFKYLRHSTKSKIPLGDVIPPRSIELGTLYSLPR
jgi:hypothetical protein